MVAIRVAGAPPPPDLISGFRRRVEEAVTAGMRGTATGLLADMRQQLTTAFPGSRRAANMITGRGYPDRGNAVSLAASALVRARGSSAAEILMSHRGSLIRAQGRGFLAIPTKEVPRIAGRQLTPRAVEAFYRAKLELLPIGAMGPQQKSAALVLRQSTRAGKRRGRVVVRTERRLRVMFWLVRQVDMPARLAPEVLVQKWVGLVPGLIDRAWQQQVRR